MSERRVATVALHIPVEPGDVRVIGIGEVIPEELHDLVKNEAAYTVEDGSRSAEPSAEELARRAAAEAEKARQDELEAEGRAAAAQAKADETARQGATGAGLDAPGAPAAPEGPAYDPSTEPEHGTPYASRSHGALQKAAKARGLKADGSTEKLAARLEADDRERLDDAE